MEIVYNELYIKDNWGGVLLGTVYSKLCIKDNWGGIRTYGNSVQ